MFEKIFKKQEEMQEKLETKQEPNNKKDGELTDEEMDMIVGGGLLPEQAAEQWAEEWLQKRQVDGRWQGQGDAPIRT